MKKITKILPLVLFPSLIMVACNKANDVSQKASIVNNDNGITELKVTVDLNGGKVNDQDTLILKVRRGTYYQYFKEGLPKKADITYIGHELTHYSFEGSTDPIGDDERILNDMTIVAQYKLIADQHTVNWLNHDGTPLVEPELYCEGETPKYKGATPVHKPVPGKSYTWTGWDPEPAPLGTEDVTYTATYSEPEITECVVSFNTDGGSAIAPILVNKGDKISTAPATPTKTGYTFDKPEGKSGWYYGSDVEFVFGTTQVNSDMTLYCKWNINQYEITFDANGGTWATTTGEELKVNVEHGKLPEPTEVLTPPEGKIFDGWTPKIVPATGTATYTAQWTAYYTVSFDTRGGTFVPSVQVKIGGTVSKPNPLPTREGHNISDWRYMKPGQETSEQFLFNEDGNPTQVNNDITVFCTWTTNSYKVLFAPNGGTWSDSTGTGDKIFTMAYGSLPNPFAGDVTLTRDKYIFTGWKRLSDGGIGILPIDVTDEEKEYCEEYTAQWEKAGDTYYTVTFDTDGGSSVIPQNVKEGDKAIKPADPTKAGMTFKNWYKDGEAATTVFDFDTAITEAITLHANWEAAKYTVTWYDEDGTTVLDSKNDYAYNASLVLPDASKTPAKFEGSNRYFFKRWSPNADTSMKVTDNMNFYAIYERNNDINLTYYSETYTIEGESEFEELFYYGDMIGFTFDETYPASNLIKVSVDGQEISTGYTYDAVTGELLIDTKDNAVKNVKNLSIVVG